MSDSVFWGVNLQGSMFRDADLSGSTFFHVLLKGVTVDGEVDRLVVNGVDVTEYVNQRDRWWPLRNNLSPDSIDGVLEAWTTLSAEWGSLLERVAIADPSVPTRSVEGEWSLKDTLRHLVFAMDKWFVLPVLGEPTFNPLGLPNTSSQGKEWPGLDPGTTPDYAEVLEVRARQHGRFSGFVSSMRTEDLSGTVSVMENGSVPALVCLHVVLEEEFEHLRYMVRDLTTLGVY